MNGIEELPGIDPSKAHVARMYDYYLGGDNNFESDRIACMELDKLVPGTRGLAINNRNYLVRGGYSLIPLTRILALLLRWPGEHYSVHISTA